MTHTLALFWLKYNAGDLNFQRLGQAFCNHFNLSKNESTDNGTAPDLFYMTDEAEVKARIREITRNWQ